MSLLRETFMCLEYGQNLNDRPIDTVNDPVIRFDQFTQVAAGDFRDQPAGLGLVFQQIRAADEPLNKRDRRDRIVFSDIRLDFAQAAQGVFGPGNAHGCSRS